MPMLVTIPGVDILAAGQWNLVSGQQEFTPGDLASAVMARIEGDLQIPVGAPNAQPVEVAA